MINEFTSLVRSRKVLVCVGSGGVGKTTSSAVVGLHEALQGRRVLVLTIDPARRLANSLGIEGITHVPTRVPVERFQTDGDPSGGELWAMMLDMKDAFDSIVKDHSPDQSVREAILTNRVYEYFSTSVAGTQEYAAAVKLLELYRSGDWDLIVLDTPPTSHALDFLEAPRRLEEAIDSRALQWLYRPSMFAGRKGLGIFSMGTSYVLKTLGRFTGTELLKELSGFLENFSVLFDALSSSSKAVRALLQSDDCSFVVVTSPTEVTIDEALYFHRRLGKESVTVGAMIVNRVHPSWIDPQELDRPNVHFVTLLGAASERLGAMEPGELSEFARRLVANAREFEVLARQDRDSIEKLRRAVREVPVQTVEYFPTDIHSLEGLNLARRSLFGASEVHS